MPSTKNVLGTAAMVSHTVDMSKLQILSCYVILFSRAKVTHVSEWGFEGAGGE